MSRTISARKTPPVPAGEPDVELLARELHEARRSHDVVMTISSRIPGIDRATAYAVQARGVALRLADGETIVGGKLGFTSVAMQRAMGVDSPNYGRLTDAMLVHDRIVVLDELIHPKVEPEIAFLLEEDLDGSATPDAARAATAAVIPCLEIVDSRFVGFRFGALDNIADNSSAGKVVLGDAAAEAAGLDLRTCGVVMSVDGEVAFTAAGAAALDDPAAAVAWMAREVAASERPLSAGDIVISGGLTPPVDLHRGMSVSLEIDRIGSATFRVV